MPLYFFNIRHRPGSAGLAVDPEGEEHKDLDAARERALSQARSMIATARLAMIHDWMACSFEIMDVQDELVLTVPFSDTVREQEED